MAQWAMQAWALAGLAEAALVALAVTGILAAMTVERRDGHRLLAAAVAMMVWGGGAWLAVLRDGAIPMLLDGRPERAWASVAAHVHATAASAGAVGAVACAGLLLVVALPDRGPRRSLLAAGAVTVALLAGPLAWALALLIVGCLVRSAAGALAFALAGAALGRGVSRVEEARLHVGLAHDLPSALTIAPMDGSAMAWAGVVGAAVILTRLQGRDSRGGPIRSGVALLGLALLLTGGAEAAAWQARATALGQGAAPELAGLAGTVAVHPGPAGPRIASACLVTREGEGWQRRPIGRAADAPGPCGGASSLVAVPFSTPASELADPSLGEGFDLLVARGGLWPTHLDAWRYQRFPLALRDPPPWDRRLALARAVVLLGDAGEVRVVGPDGQQAPDPTELRGSGRLDVVVLPGPGFSVAELVSTCHAFRRERPLGVRCVIGRGDRDRWVTWAGRAVPPPPPVTVDVPPMVLGEPERGLR